MLTTAVELIIVGLCTAAALALALKMLPSPMLSRVPVRVRAHPPLHRRQQR